MDGTPAARRAADGQWLGLLDHLVVGNASPVADGTWLLLLDDVVGNASPVAAGPWLLLLDDIACAGNRERASDATATPMAERWTIGWSNYG